MVSTTVTSNLSRKEVAELTASFVKQTFFGLELVDELSSVIDDRYASI